MNKIPYILTGNSLTVLQKNNRPLSITKADSRFSRAIELIKSKDFDGLVKLLNVAAVITEYTNGSISIVGKRLYYNGKESSGGLAERILEFYYSGLPFNPWEKFLENVNNSPNADSAKDAYEFVERNKMPLTEDGCFLAYRKVDSDYSSYHLNPDGTKNYNKVGSVVKMDRAKCDMNRGVECSTGLHFCSFEYLPHYNGGKGRTMIVKINPKNITSTPPDYNGSKGRCCEYEVVGECKENDKVHVLTNKLYTGDKLPRPVKNWNKRGPGGRFLSKSKVKELETKRKRGLIHKIAAKKR